MTNNDFQTNRFRSLQVSFVTPWYSKNIPGGAESEVRETAKNLAAAGVEVQILTTCLKGLGTNWDLEQFPSGKSIEDGIPILRFSVAPRNSTRFNMLNTRIMANEQLTKKEEDDFFLNMINSPSLINYISIHPELGPFFFIPYLFTTSVWGSLIHPHRSVLIPCLHDEAYARMQTVRQAFESVHAIVFHTPAERNLGASLYNFDYTKSLLLGEGVYTNWSTNPKRFRIKYNIQEPFLLYAGRKDTGKNIPLLIQYFLRYLHESYNKNKLKLLLIGNLPAPIPINYDKSIIDLGFISNQDKYDAYSAASIFINPSIKESFSIVIMEAWLAGTAVLVHSDCAVTREHVEASNGGLHFRDYPHFVECLNFLLSNPTLTKQMAKAGRAYVLKNFNWTKIIKRFISLIKSINTETLVPIKIKKKNRHRPAVHQMLPDFTYGDAIGNEVLTIQKTLQSWNLYSEIFAVNIHSKMRHIARPAKDYALIGESKSILIFHFSIGHAIVDEVVNFPGRKILRYHNITPSHFLEQVYPLAAHRCLLGRKQLKRISKVFELALGVSTYNCNELLEVGYHTVVKMPFFLNLEILQTPPDSITSATFNDNQPTILHIGRLVPNKCIEDLIKTQYWLTKLMPNARLLIVGENQTNNYAFALRNLVLQLNIPNVFFCGHVNNSVLTAYYRAANLYLCLSEHEGFCVPLVEAMYFGLPIIAFAAAGIPETLGEGGLLLPQKDHLIIAELIAKILKDSILYQKLSQTAKTRLKAFQPSIIEAQLQKIVFSYLGLKNLL